jgi:hypothetical protein
MARTPKAFIAQIHCEPQYATDETGQAGHHVLARTLAFDEALTVVGMTGATVATPVQSPVRFIPHPVGQHWRERPRLGMPRIVG